jgi:two-component system, NtrC family, sensor histidine kinase PilS
MNVGLDHGLKRLMLFRVVMVTTLLMVAASMEAVSETLRPVNPLYFLIAATYALTILYGLALRFLPLGSWQVYVQVILDFLVVTGLVYVTGGIPTRAGFVLLYPIAVLAGSVLLYRRDGLVLAGLATLSYAALVWVVREGRVAVGPGFADLQEVPAKQVLYSIFVVGVSCVTVALIGAYLSESLKSAGRRLEEASEQMADLQELNKVIVDSIQSGLITADRGGRLLFVNRFGESMLGLTGSHPQGQGVQEIFNSHLLDPPVLQTRAAMGGLRRFEVPYRRPDGTELDLGVSVSPLAEPAGGFLLVFQDLTQITRLQNDIRLKEKLAAVGEMAALLAHEIRNPLGSISGSAQVLVGEPNMSPDQQRLLTIITQESRRLSETLNQFLFQARPAVSPPAPVDVGRVVSEAVTLLRHGSEVGSRHVVEFHADEGPHICLADSHRITQVFWNLARNALEAMPEGGTLEVRLRRSEGDLVLSLRDQGTGVAGQDRHRLFEPFHSGRPLGTGLGLAIVYRIVREHRGDITVRSTPRVGTEVEVRLPLVSTHAVA